MKRTTALVVCAVLAAVLVGCASPQQQQQQQTATFVGYETRGTGVYQESLTPDDNGVISGPEIREPTGNAYIKLADGTQVTATCPVEGLRSGNTVLIEQSEDGSWSVTGKR